MQCLTAAWYPAAVVFYQEFVIIKVSMNIVH